MWILILFSLGVLHGVGPDHLAAITAYGAATGRDLRRIVSFAVRFALGHALVLGIAGVAAKFGSMMLPERWETRFDLIAATLLGLTGVILLTGLLTGVIKLHTHHHHHDHSVHHHFHLHMFNVKKHEPSAHPHLHGSTAVGLGALFAMGGARSLLFVVPIALAPTVAGSLIRVAVFCCGIVASMAAYGWLTQVALMKLERFADGTHNRKIMLVSAYVVAFFCIFASCSVFNEHLHFLN
jgi:nickel/cobalt transporter (NicO) family protein